MAQQPSRRARLARLLDDMTLRQSLAANTTPALDALIDFDSMVDEYAQVFQEAWLSGGTRARADVSQTNQAIGQISPPRQ